MSTTFAEPKTETAPHRGVKVGVNTLASTLPARLSAAALCLTIAIIHIKDQGGFPGNKQPTYVGIGYYLLELGAVVAAGLLLSRASRKGWFVALAVAVGPMIGYALSRGPGLPLYRGDRGHWMEALGIISLLVEGTLLVLSLATARNRNHGNPHPLSTRT